MNRKYLLEFCKMMFAHCMWVWYGLYDTVLDSTFKKLRSWYPVPSLCGKLKTGADFIFLGSKITEDSDYTHKVRRLLLLGRKAMTNLDSILKSRDIFAYKGLHSQSYGFSSSCVEVWELDHKEGWMLKNWCFQTVVLEKTLESPLDCKEIKPVNPKGNQYWIFIGKTDTEAPILWPLMQRADSLKKTLMLGKIEARRRRWWQRIRWLDDITDLMDMNLSRLLEIVTDREAWCAESIRSQRVGHDLVTEQQQ